MSTPSLAQKVVKNQGHEYRIVKSIYYVLMRSVFPGDVNNNKILCIEKGNKLTEYASQYFPSKKIRDAAIRVKVWPEYKGYDLKECNIVILGSSEQENQLLLMALNKTQILTISTLSDITSMGGMIYMPQTKRVPPKINIDALKRSGIMIDASILSLSKRAWDSPK